MSERPSPPEAPIAIYRSSSTGAHYPITQRDNPTQSDKFPHLSDAARKRKAGAVVIDGLKHLDPKYPLQVGAIHTIQVGKKWRRVAV